MVVEARVAVPVYLTPFRIARKEGKYQAIWTNQTARETSRTYEASPAFASADRVRSYMANVYADIREVKA
jgi:hypothetical protein